MKISEFLRLFKLGKVGAKSHMKNLIEVAMVDGEYDKTEEKLLNSLAKKHRISKKQLREIHDAPEHIDFEVPGDDKSKFEQLYELVHMMVADNFVDEAELKLCAIFARKYGYDPDNAEELVHSISQNIQHGNTLKEIKIRVSRLLSTN